jgi:hypothetical protein
LKPRGLKVKPWGSGLKPWGSALKPWGSGLKPRGSGLKPWGSELKPRGSELKPWGSELKSRDSALDSRGLDLDRQGSEREGKERMIKGINIAGQALDQKQISDLRPPAAASAASCGVLNPSFPHPLNHARASTVAISLRSSIKRIRLVCGWKFRKAESV